jgi:DNA-binding response OmpR family regulator
MTPRRPILIVDDDIDLAGLVAEELQREGFQTAHAPMGSEGIVMAMSGDYGLVLLDIDLPDMDGRDVCRLMRDEGVHAPILMLTGKVAEDDEVLGLDAGANDYVTKPFKVATLLARIRAHMRSHEQSEEAIFAVGPYSFRPSVKMLTDDNGKKVRLTEKETNILKYLYRAGRKAVPRDELLKEVWGYNPNVTTHTLETHIYRLRQKIEPDPGTARLLVTEPGGYRLEP